MRPRTLSVLLIDSNNFSRQLVADILRGMDVSNISSVRNGDDARLALLERPHDVILLSWEQNDAFDALAYCRALRCLPEDRLRRIPVVLITSHLTREMVIAGRDAGVDEFLARPLTPGATRQRLEMVIETPRPFVDCSVFVGPCRRRKNPADYYGAKRRAGDATDTAIPMIDQEEVAAQTPIRRALAALRQACDQLNASRPETLVASLTELRVARDLATDLNDAALRSSLGAFETYLITTCPTGQLDTLVVTTSLDALEQLCSLPQTYVDARNSVATALGKAIQKKLAA